jgi:UDP-4-amino-4-deoxy-L-arabinose formyltransferase/UDP-glucuronic acid dehydrogenase (UDP-4-keto-hexauronic acid decarboxylating)
MKAVLFADEWGLDIFENTVIPKWDICGIVTSKKREKAIAKAQQLSRKYSIAHFIQPYKNHGRQWDNFFGRIKEFSPDIVLVNSYSQILPSELINIPPMGSFNLHAGILPEYRGSNIINWVLINGEKESGVTLHKMTGRIDAGPVVVISKVGIDFSDTAFSLREKLKAVTEQIIAEIMPAFEKNNVCLSSQDEANARYWPKRKPEDGYFSWDWDALKIYNLIRALVAPWPGAYTLIDGKKIICDRFFSLEEVKRLKDAYSGSHTPA